MRYFIFIITLLFISPALAWDGYDWDNGGYIEVERGNLVREGETIEIYDWDAGEYRDVEVEDINTYGGSVELEVYDTETGEYRTFDMDEE